MATQISCNESREVHEGDFEQQNIKTKYTIRIAKAASWVIRPIYPSRGLRFLSGAASGAGAAEITADGGSRGVALDGDEARPAPAPQGCKTIE
jgi:hypothetical protein